MLINDPPIPPARSGDRSEVARSVGVSASPGQPDASEPVPAGSRGGASRDGGSPNDGPDWRRRAERAEQRAQALECALVSRASLDQAKGVVMAVFGLDAEHAFDALVWVSQHSNVKVAEIAEQLLGIVRGAELGWFVREEVTAILAELSRPPADRAPAGSRPL